MRPGDCCIAISSSESVIFDGFVMSAYSRSSRRNCAVPKSVGPVPEPEVPGLWICGRISPRPNEPVGKGPVSELPSWRRRGLAKNDGGSSFFADIGLQQDERGVAVIPPLVQPPMRFEVRRPYFFSFGFAFGNEQA